MTQQPGTTAGGASSMSFFGGQFSTNPFPLLAQMRAMGAIVQVPVPFDPAQKVWMVTRLEEAVQVLKDRRFTVDCSVGNTNDVYRQRAQLEADNPALFGQVTILVGR